MKRGVRGKRKGLKLLKKSLRFLGVNTAGLKSKLTSFKKVITDLKPSVFFLQETKFKEEGNIKLGNDYIVYELLRKSGSGGGLALGCHKDLNPCWISEGGEKAEALSVDIFLKNIKIRCCVAYGPQESDSVEKKHLFWEHLENEVYEAEKSGSGFILQFDGNLWAGNHIIPGDPRCQNKNGKYFEQFLSRNSKLTVVNSLPQCEGLITRSRNKNGILEESVLDFFVVCNTILPFVEKMVIDEEKNHILTNYKGVKTNGRAVDSDHFTEYLDLNIEYVKETSERQEIYNFKDKRSQETFKINTSETKEFTECFNGKENLISNIENWRKVLNFHCAKAFKKIRINNKKMKPISQKISALINDRNELVKKGCVCQKTLETESNAEKHQGNHSRLKTVCKECGKQFIRIESLKIHMTNHSANAANVTLFGKKEITRRHLPKQTKSSKYRCKKCGKTFHFFKTMKEHLKAHKEGQKYECDFCAKKLASMNIAIAEEEARENRNKIMKQFKIFSENPENINMQNMWKILKNICPKRKSILPSAKKNHRGKIVSSGNDIKKLLFKEYKNRLRSRPCLDNLIPSKSRKKRLFDLKLKFAENNKSQLWTSKELEKALNDLKRNKSRDSEGFLNEIFKNDVIGSDLRASLLILCNNLKREKMIPKFLNNANITTVPKKGPTIELKNQRGIFRVSVIRSILMRLIYNSKYEEIDKNISDCQMGARKGKGCKSNIWTINGIIHETLKNRNKKPIVLQIYDYAQMFDSIDLEEAISDIFEYGLNDDNLSLIYKANNKVHMAVKTAAGLTKRDTIENSVLQGDTFGSLLASVQVDTIAKEVEKANIGYKYKEELPINILGLVDDIIGVTEAGFKAQMMNTILNYKSAEKRLQFGISKCKYMMIGKKKENVINNTIYLDGWKEEYRENTENGEVDLEDKYIGKIAIEEVNKQKYLGFVISSKGNNLENIQEIEKKSKGIVRTIMTKLEKLKTILF